MITPFGPLSARTRIVSKSRVPYRTSRLLRTASVLKGWPGARGISSRSFCSLIGSSETNLTSPTGCPRYLSAVADDPRSGHASAISTAHSQTNCRGRKLFKERPFRVRRWFLEGKSKGLYKIKKLFLQQTGRGASSTHIITTGSPLLQVASSRGHYFTRSESCLSGDYLTSNQLILKTERAILAIKSGRKPTFLLL
jgi:hypothetical protein